MKISGGPTYASFLINANIHLNENTVQIIFCTLNLFVKTSETFRILCEHMQSERFCLISETLIASACLHIPLLVLQSD